MLLVEVSRSSRKLSSCGSDATVCTCEDLGPRFRKCRARRPMRPCTRAVCSHCGLNVGLLGVNGFGMMRRRHERRCRGSRAAAVRPPAPLFPTLLPRVDVNREIQRMSTKELAESLTVTGKELQSVLRHDRVIGEEVMKCAVVAWRPGSSEHAPLRPAMAVQPGDTTDRAEVPGNGYTTHPKPNKNRAGSCKYP